MTSLDGIILVNKSAGISSAGVVRKIKKFNGIHKIGHTGTLDPFATGLLICCINRATRLSRFFLNGKKKYNVTMQLGIDTDTQDFTGNITKEYDFNFVTTEDIMQVVTMFKGRMHQTPPFFSALKYNGTPLYKLARKGVHINKPPRNIYIYNLDICDINLPEVTFEIHCSAGTYVRTICADIGNFLGCGGHLKSLHRTNSSNFSIYQAHELEYLELLNFNNKLSDCILSMADSLNFIPSYSANQFLVKKIRNGVKLESSSFINPANSNITTNESGLDSKFLKIVDDQLNLVAILESSDSPLFYKYCCVF